DVYRGEYLAWQMLRALEAAPGSVPAEGGAFGGNGAALRRFLDQPAEQRLAAVQEFMASRYQDGYTRGLHDLDGVQILTALAAAHAGLERARFHPTARACAAVFWTRFCPAETRSLWGAKLRGFAERNRLFPGDPAQGSYIRSLQGVVAHFLGTHPLYPGEMAAEAGEYLFYELTAGEAFSVTREADHLATAFHQHLVIKGHDDTFAAARQALASHPASELELVRDWVRGYLLAQPEAGTAVEEVAAIVFCGDALPRAIVQTGARTSLEGMKGVHRRLEGGRYVFDYLDFTVRLRRFGSEVVPRFEAYHRLKGTLIDRERARLRLEEFRPRVLSSFVRNQLTDRVYLPLVGDNLAKQVGAAGAARRTDQMGLLLLISPPGYGKTT
ncbi:MAG: AAA family ATPase, partial [Verrucomicrobiota bacterium]